MARRAPAPKSDAARQTVAPETSPAPEWPDFFGSEAEIADARRLRDDAAAGVRPRARAALQLAWALRQRDTRAALRHADEAEAEWAALVGPTAEAAREQRCACARLQLVRAEAAWLFHRMTEAESALSAAREGFAAAGDELGLGDADLLETSLRDQRGGDRGQPLQSAHRRFGAAGLLRREQLAATWLACTEATAQPDAAQAHWGRVLEAAAALNDPGFTTFIEAARGTLAWRRGDPAGAIRAFRRGHEAALQAGHLHSAITLAHNVGLALSTLNDHEAAIEWVERARALVAPTGWPYLQAWVLMQAGSVLLGCGRPREARALLQQGLPLIQGTEGSRNHALAGQVLGEACVELGEFEAALPWLQGAVRTGRQLGHPDLVSGALRHLALALAGLGRVDEALEAAADGLAVALAESDWSRVAAIEHVCAGIAARHALPLPAGSPHASARIHHLHAALQCGARMAGFEPPPEWLAELSAAYEAAADLPQALVAERAAARARRQQQVRRAEDAATALVVRHQTEQALAEAERQRARAEANALRTQLVQAQAALEHERLQSMLVHAGKMVTVGRLASGLVHEMSHPVGTLLLLAEALVERLRSEAAAAELTDAARQMLGETQRLQRLVARLRDFARAEPPRLAAHDLRAVGADARALYGPRLAAEGIECREALARVEVQVDPERLALALANLVLNAADALAGRAAPHIQLSTELRDDEVDLHVDDNGPGLSAPVRARLFEPFFTTKPAGKGLGLGLALCAEAVASMGGRVGAAAQGALGGARFTLSLRRVPRAVADVPAAAGGGP